MPLTRNFPRRVNALGGKRPQATGIVLIPKNNGNVLKTSNGSTANYGGNTKFGLYPNVGMSYLFQNKIGVGSLFYNTTTPSQVNPPQSNSQAGASSSHPGLVEETNNSITFTYLKSNTYGVTYKQIGSDQVAEDDMFTTSAAKLYDLDLSNRELYTNLIGALPVEGTANSPLVESDMPVAMFMFNNAPGSGFSGAVQLYVYDDDPDANYIVSWTQTNNANSKPFPPYWQALDFYDTTTQNRDPYFRDPPVGLNGYYIGMVDFANVGILSYEGDGGLDNNNNPALPINFSPGSTNNTPLKITITKSESPLYSGNVI